MSGQLMDESHPEHPYNLIPELCRNFYRLGWATGTGGGISIRLGDKYYVAPSGVQKERIESDDIFILDSNQAVVQKPKNFDCKALKVSECTPLFFAAYSLRGAGACLHSHSQSAVLISMLYDTEFAISNQEMIKGIPDGAMKPGETKRRNLTYRDTLRIPIIRNTDREIDLEDSLREAIEKNPHATAVIVRRHGIYVWGDTWQQAKGAAECIEYLMSLALQMHRFKLPVNPVEPA